MKINLKKIQMILAISKYCLKSNFGSFLRPSQINLDGFFVKNFGCQSNLFCKTDNKAKWYEKAKYLIFDKLEKNCFEKW